MTIEITERERQLLILGMSVSIDEGYTLRASVTDEELDAIAKKLGIESANHLLFASRTASVRLRKTT